jgi:putative ABC transport system substrate-binding protein
VRLFVAAAAGLLLLGQPCIAFAQAAGRAATIAWLVPPTPGAACAARPTVEADVLTAPGRALLAGLRELGYVLGTNLSLDRHCARTADEFGARLRDVLQRRPDVIVVTSTSWAVQARAATKTIPIVCTACSDPVDYGLVTSLARPGGNVTGLASLSRELTGKRVELLKQAVPGSTRLAVLVNPGSVATAGTVTSADAAGRSVGMEIHRFDFRVLGDFDAAFRSAVTRGAHAVLVQDDPASSGALAHLAQLGVKHRLPIVTGFPNGADEGLLLAYGPDRVEMWHRSARFIDRLLKGEKPGDLPFELPTKLDLVLNVRTAKALGLTIPPSLLLRATRVVE